MPLYSCICNHIAILRKTDMKCVMKVLMDSIMCNQDTEMMVQTLCYHTFANVGLSIREIVKRGQGNISEVKIVSLKSLKREGGKPQRKYIDAHDHVWLNTGNFAHKIIVIFSVNSPTIPLLLRDQWFLGFNKI